MIGFLNTVNVAIAAALDNEVSDWYTNVRNDGGEADQRTLEALNKFMRTLKVNSIRNKIKRCNLFCGHNLRSSLHPIIKSAKEGGARIGNEKDVNRGFNNADYTPRFGLWANLTIPNTSPATKYLKTGAHISQLGIDGSGGHLSFMSATSDNPVKVSSVGGYIMPLCGGDIQNNFDLSAFIEFNYAERTIKGASAGAKAPGQEGYAESYLGMEFGISGLYDEEDFSGLWVASRDSSTSQKLYLGNNDGVKDMGTDSNDTDQSSYPIGGYKFRIFATTPVDSIGTLTQSSSYKLLFYSIGDTMTQEETAILNNALIDFNKTVIRGGRT